MNLRNAWCQRTLTTALLAMLLVMLWAEGAAAHTGEGVSLEHVIIEIGTWALAVAGVIGAVVVLFWLRARYRRGE